MKKIMAVLFALLLTCSLCLSASADRIPEEHNFRYIGAMKVVRCKEYVTLRNVPYKTGKALAKVPLGAIVYNCRTIKEKKSFVYAEYEGLQGYILVQFLDKAPEFEPAVTSAITQKNGKAAITTFSILENRVKQTSTAVLSLSKYFPTVQNA